MDSKGALRLLLLWLLISSVYYVDTLLTGNFTVDYAEGTNHKIIKYVVCLAFSIYLLCKARRFGMLFIALAILAIAGLLVVTHGALVLSMLVWVTLGSMGGFVAVFQVWKDKADRIAAWIVYSAVVVGIFSIIELSLLSAVLASYWASTGAIRSVSTMFNPNNLGMYTGAALIFLPFIPGTRLFKSLMALPIIFALVASGSRTAWVALAVVVPLMLLADADIRDHSLRYLRRHAVSVTGAAVLCVLLITAVKVEDADQYDGAYRGADLYTASIRVENFMTYVGSLDWTILLPDLGDVRTHLIQDNFYLVALSGFGLIPLLVLGVFFLSQHTLYRHADPHNRLWRWVFVYYMISGLSGSFLNSFPNNQLFFIAMGAFFVDTVRRSGPAARVPVRLEGGR